MPVEDHPVHAHGKRTAPTAGCHNKARSVPPLQAWDTEFIDNPDGSFVRVPRVQWVEHRMSTLCQQDGSLPECRGCKNANQGASK